MDNIDGLRTQAKALQEKHLELWTRLQAIAFSDDEGLSNEDRDEFDKLHESASEVEKDLRRIESVIANADERAKDAARLEDLPAGVLGDAKDPTPEEQRAEEAEAYRTAFDKYLRGGMERLEADERDMLQAQFVEVDQRAQATNPGSAGGFTIPEGFVNQIVEAQKAFGGLRMAPITQLTTASGNDLPIPTNDDTGNVGILIAENALNPEQDTTFGQKTLKAYTWSSQIIRVSVQLLQDSAFDMDSFIAGIAGTRIGRGQAPYWVSGTGVDQPEGILTGTAVEAAAAATTLAYDDFVNLEHAVDPAYRSMPSASYVLSDSALKQARLIKDLDDRPLWTPAIGTPLADRWGATINGYSYVVDVNFPAVATTETPVLFGALDHYWIRDVLSIQALRLTERYADYLQVGFLFFSRSDGRKVNAGDDPFKALQMA